MTDVSVKPVRTFWHGEIKTKRSPAFSVETGMAHELKTLGLVEIQGGKADSEPDVEAKEPAVEPAVEPVTDPAPKKKAKSNATDKNS